MSTHNIGFLMSTHNRGFYEQATKTTFELSSNKHLICSSEKVRLSKSGEITHLLFHLFNLFTVFVKDMFPYKLRSFELLATQGT